MSLPHHRRRQRMLVASTMLALGIAGVWFTFLYQRAHRETANAAATTHASVLTKVRRLQASTHHATSPLPTGAGAAADLMPGLLDAMRVTNLDPVHLTAHDIGEARAIQGTQARRRLVTLTFDELTPGDLALLLSNWSATRPPMRSVQLTHQTRNDDNVFQVRVVLELIEPTARESVS